MSPHPAASDPIRVLHCIATLQAGGAESQLVTLCKAANAHAPELAFHVAHVVGGPHLRDLSQSGATVHSLPVRSVNDPRIPFLLADILRRNRIDVVHTWLTASDVLGGSAALLARKPYIVSERSSAECYPPGWKRSARRFFARRAAAVVANSRSGIHYWQETIRPERLHLIPNALDASRLDTAARLDTADLALLKQTPKLVLFAGRLTLAKNLDVLCDAFDLVVAQRKDVLILLFGDGELRGDVEQRLRAAGNEKIRWMGFTDRLPSWLRSASAFVSLSRFEGQPNVVLEAAYLRVPQVLSNIPQHRDTLGDDGAFFTGTGSAENAAQAISECLDDQVARDRKVEAAYARVAVLTPEHIIGEYEKLYRKIAGR